ncbi:hypothetical protein PHYPSEUDO_009409 [Phytophthora pseudosyringae]|uniref:Uncharacterized protein n=1 Tax=Phytophthora pseudosyringae TaxID=221518 RepID=A0A8T1VFD5_9STRA|nr:hypothetical protein PHYPSEUDO_009409 [Phytophthora pseudosyringae]
MVPPTVTDSRTSAVVSEPGDMHSEVSASTHLLPTAPDKAPVAVTPFSPVPTTATEPPVLLRKPGTWNKPARGPIGTSRAPRTLRTKVSKTSQAFSPRVSLMVDDTAERSSETVGGVVDTAEGPAVLNSIPIRITEGNSVVERMLPDTAEVGTGRHLHRDDTALDAGEKGEVEVADEVEEFDIYDSNRFIAAMSRQEWSQDPDADDPNLCESGSETDEPDEVDTEDYIAQVMGEEVDLTSDYAEVTLANEERSDDEGDLRDGDFYEDVADGDWRPREETHPDPEFISDAELRAVADNWEVYDEDHSEEFQMEGATDLEEIRGYKVYVPSHGHPIKEITDVIVLDSMLVDEVVLEDGQPAPNPDEASSGEQAEAPANTQEAASRLRDTSL